jgi:hypothetical protein
MKVPKDYIKCFFTILFLPAILFSQTTYKSKQSGLWSDFNASSISTGNYSLYIVSENKCFT